MENENFKKLADEVRNVEAPIIDWFANTPEEMCLNADGNGLSKLNKLMTMLNEGTVSDPHDINYTLDSVKSFGKKWTIPEGITTVLFNEYHTQPQGDLLSGVVDHYYGHLGGSKYGKFSFSDLKETAQEYFIGRKKTGPKEFVEFLGLVKNGVSEDSSELITELVETYNAVNSERLDINPEMVDACYEKKLALAKLGNRVNIGHNMRFEVERSGEGSGELNLYISGINDDFEKFVETYGAVQDPEINHKMGMLNDRLDEMYKRLDE
jgi:hypothetical protein